MLILAGVLVYYIWIMLLRNSGGNEFYLHLSYKSSRNDSSMRSVVEGAIDMAFLVNLVGTLIRLLSIFNRCLIKSVDY